MNEKLQERIDVERKFGEYYEIRDAVDYIRYLICKDTNAKMSRESVERSIKLWATTGYDWE